MARRRLNTTKHEIIQQATKLFLEHGYSATSPHMICDALDISTGNLTYYFPTKEHLLVELVDMLCGYQWKLMKKEAADGYSSLMAICLELLTMAVACEEDEVARDFFLSAYTSPMAVDIIRRNDKERAREVFKEYCPNWTEEHFIEAESLVSGIEYATLLTTSDSAPLETRVTGALNTILTIYNVPENVRKTKIKKMLELEYRFLGRQVLRDFKEYVDRATEQALLDLRSMKKKTV